MSATNSLRWYERPRNLFWIGFVVRVLCIVIAHSYKVRVRDDHWEFGYEAGRIARNVVEGRGYSSPFNGWTGPTAWLPPIYPLMMAACFKLFGVYTNMSVFAIMVLDSLFSAATIPAVYEIAQRCFDARGFARRSSTMIAPVAVWSAWIWALHPEVIQYPMHWIWEMSLSTCLIAWAFVYALRLRRVGENEQPNNSIAMWLIYGLFWGLLALSNTTLMITWAGVTGWILWPQKTNVRALLGAVLSFVMVFVCLTPWIIRNERVMHAFIPARSNAGIELWNASLWYHDAFPWGAAVPLSPTDPEFKRFQQMGEVKYAKMKQEQAMANIKAQPKMYAKFTAYRVQYFWFIWRHPSDAKVLDETLRLWNYGIVSLCGLIGVALAIKRRVPGAWMMFWVLLLMPIPYYLVTIQARFRYPMEPLICVLGVYLFRSTEKKIEA
ncbi:glycosyltransferase family 39 protein [Granulicella cerasi]|uniref:Glycosyltransferase family 39 protein n=1 Tax=Granulicella cerasi TaxID=741063 RepID=A0ABW1Z838_9BACT|nr:glycosyltransferase family 39 protein [Granulicella cerasi]